MAVAVSASPIPSVNNVELREVIVSISFINAILRTCKLITYYRSKTLASLHAAMSAIKPTTKSPSSDRQLFTTLSICWTDVGTGESVSVQHDVAKGNSDDDWSLSTHASTSGCLSNLI